MDILVPQAPEYRVVRVLVSDTVPESPRESNILEVLQDPRQIADMEPGF
jgi:hypothetical protein